MEGSKPKGRREKRRGASREGLKALFGGPGVEAEAAKEVAGPRPKAVAEEPEVRAETRMDAIARAAEEALSSPRITVHSPLTSAVLRYLKATRPRFSMSEELRLIVEDAIGRKYPSISELVAKAMLEKKIERLRQKVGA